MNLQGRKFENGFMGWDVEVFKLPDSPHTWFIGKDVAEMLEYVDASATISKKVWSSNKTTQFVENINIKSGSCQNGNTRNVHNNITLISEAGLYQLIFGSKMPKAEEFQRWVFEDVLPTIREFGSYIAWQDTEDPDVIIDRAEMAKEATLVKMEGEALLVDGDYKHNELHSLMKDCVNCIHIGDFAKVIASNTNIKIGRNRLFRWLRDHGFLDVYNMPFQVCVEKDWFRMKQNMIRISKDRSIVRCTPLITPLGESVVMDAMLREGVLDYGEEAIEFADGTVGIWDDQSQQLIKLQRTELQPYLDAIEVK